MSINKCGENLQMVVSSDTVYILPIDDNEYVGNIWEGVTIPEETEYLKISADVTYIPENFAKGSDIREVNIPDSVEEIGNSAFEDCVNLEYVDFPEDPTSDLIIGQKAFAHCTSLQDEVTIHGKEIQKDAFANCNISNASINVSKIAEGAFKNNEIEYLQVGPRVRAIGSFAFAGNDIKGSRKFNATLPVTLDGIKVIGENAFEGNHKLMYHALPNIRGPLEEAGYYPNGYNNHSKLTEQIENATNSLKNTMKDNNTPNIPDNSDNFSL